MAGVALLATICQTPPARAQSAVPGAAVPAIGGEPAETVAAVAPPTPGTQTSPGAAPGDPAAPAPAPIPGGTSAPVAPDDLASIATTATPKSDPRRVTALLLNGGARPAVNYQSHVAHLRSMLHWLERVGVPPSRISVFSGDGDDPAADLAVREFRSGEGDEAALLDGTRVEGRFGHPIEYVSTRIEGVRLLPAKKAALQRWFATRGRSLRAGDTLLLHVTDHGTRGKKDPDETRILLWGEHEWITARELDSLLARVPAGVRVVSLMSQCFSGGFARLGRTAPKGVAGLPTGRSCGYFSSTADRRAYGCYPENRGKANVGHSVRFIEALERTGDFPLSQEIALLSDRTPDVPLRSSDVQLEQLLEAAAAARGQTLREYADAMLEEAWRDRAAWEPEIRSIDRIGRAFGMASPRSVAEVDERIDELPQLAGPLATWARAWSESRDDLSEANLGRFMEKHPEWSTRLASPQATPKPAPTPATPTPAPTPADPANAESDSVRHGRELLAELVPFTRSDEVTDARLRVLRERARLAHEASYRMEVREAALRRMRAGLIGIAGRVHLARHASPVARTAFARLFSCEAFALPLAGATGAIPPLESEPALPPYAEDVRVAHEVAPAWMGISFHAPSDAQRSLVPESAPGAIAVREVYPDSPAQQAGLEVGDVILGPSGSPFREPRQVREWTMLRPVGSPVVLDVLHEGAVVQRTLVPGPHPGKFPELPGPPEPGSPAPPLDLASYRGSVPASLADGKTRLLFFWATWCMPCKESLPEVMAFARERGTEVLAVTDEESTALDAFFAASAVEFPPVVLRDVRRRTHRTWGVSGTPTFVLVDGAGKVVSVSSGYTPAKGLGVPGWKWNGALPAPTAGGSPADSASADPGTGMRRQPAASPR